MRPATLITSLFLTLALGGCGGEAALEISPERWCATSAYVELTNPGLSERRYSGWQVADGSGSYNLPAFHLGSGDALRVWRGVGQSDDRNIYLGQREAAWDFRREQVRAESSGWLFLPPEEAVSFFTCDVLPAP
jgi:hypothetical protein